MNRAVVAPTAFLRLLTSHCYTAASNPFLGVVAAAKYAYGRPCEYLPASWCSLSPCLYYSFAVHKLQKSAEYRDYFLNNLLVETALHSNCSFHTVHQWLSGLRNKFHYYCWQEDHWDHCWPQTWVQQWGKESEDKTIQKEIRLVEHQIL